MAVFLAAGVVGACVARAVYTKQHIVAYGYMHIASRQLARRLRSTSTDASPMRPESGAVRDEASDPGDASGSEDDELPPPDNHSDVIAQGSSTLSQVDDRATLT